MNIGFDAKRAFVNGTGLGNYSRFVINQLSTQFPENNYFSYTTKITDRFSPEANNTVITAPKSKLKQGYWRSFSIKNQLVKNDIQIFHGLSNELPFGIDKLKNIKSVVTIHDLIFMRFPEFYPFFDRLIYKKKFELACNQSDAIVAISQQTANDIQEFFKIDDSKIKIIYQDCSSLYHQKPNNETIDEILKTYNLTQNEYIICVGTMEERKNQLKLVQALAQTNNKSIKLVFAGKPTDYKKLVFAEVAKLKLQSQVQFLDYIPLNHLPALYAGARINVYVSVFEGFGIPLVEAANMGTPIITSLGSCFAEAAGEGAVYINPNDISSIANAVDTVWNDGEKQTKMRNEGLIHVQKFRPEITINQLHELYKSLI